MTALLRLDRLRGTPYAPAVDALLVNLPDRRDLLEGTGVDLYEDIDAILIATPNPLDARVTFLAARHRLTDGAMRAALERGARATNRKLTWRFERGRPFAERRARAASATTSVGAGDGGVGVPEDGANRANRDERLILLPAPNLVVVTPPAYRRLILAAGQAAPPIHRDAGAPTTEATASDAGRDGGVRPAVDDPNGWATLVRRIDAEDSILPPDAVAMVSAVDLFSARRLRGGFVVAPSTRGSVEDEPAGARGGMGTANIMGLPFPEAVTATLGVTPQPFADIDGEFSRVADAVRWEEGWPSLRQKLRANPLVVLSGFSALLGRVTLTRTGAAVRVHVDATELETTRILQLVAAQMSAMRR